MLKRVIPLILCCLMLVACGSGSAVELLDFIDANDGEINYFGRVIEAFQSDDGGVWPYSATTVQADALLARIDDIEKTLNVRIEMSDDGDGNFVEYYNTTTAAGTCDMDLIYRHGGNSLWFLAEAGALHPITDFSDKIDLSDTDKYGTPGVLEAAMHNGIPYAVQPVQWPGLQGIECFFIVYNTEELAANGVSDLHEYYENQTWTWDTFKNILYSAAPYLEREGDLVFEAHGGYLLNTLFMANGFDYITFENGTPYFDLTPEEALEAIDFLKELSLLGDKIEIDDPRWEYDSFIAGNSLTTLATAAAVTNGNIAYGSNFQYQIMPFPSGPSVEYGKWQQSVTRIYGLAIPLGADDPECVAHVINLLCEPFEEFGGSKEGLIEYYRENVFATDIDVEIFFAVENNVRYDYDDAGLINEYTQLIAESIDKASTTELIERNSNIVKSIFEQYIEPNLTGYIIEHMNLQ